MYFFGGLQDQSVSSFYHLQAVFTIYKVAEDLCTSAKGQKKMDQSNFLLFTRWPKITERVHLGVKLTSQSTETFVWSQFGSR